jgi:hypothetical protein
MRRNRFIFIPNKTSLQRTGVYVKRHRLKMGRSSSLVRTLALRAKGRRFKSGPAHQPAFLTVDSALFDGLLVENCVIKCRWFSNVLLKLKPISFDFASSSLSRYNAGLCLFDNAYAPERMRGAVLCYKAGHFPNSKEEDYAR